MVPIDLTPRWRDVPALAWMAGRAFQSRVPGLAAASRLGLWPLFVASFVAARGLGELAAVDRTAVVAVADRACRAWQRHLILAGTMMAVFAVPVAVMFAFGIAGAAVSAAGAPRAGQLLSDLGAALYLVAVVLAVVGVCTRVRWPHLRDLPAGRRIVARRHPRLVEASDLAVDPARRGTVTVLWRRLRHVADETGYAVLAYAADEKLARIYSRSGFLSVLPTTDKVVCRPPQGHQFGPGVWAGQNHRGQ